MAKWTKEEEKLLIELVQSKQVDDIAKILGRSNYSIRHKIKNLKLEYFKIERKYTKEELDYIKDNWKTISISEMARTLKVTSTMIQRQAKLMNLEKVGNNPRRKWTNEELKRLRELAKEKSIEELAKEFNTTKTAISNIAYKNNIKLNNNRICWTKEENEQLVELSKTMTLQEIALETGKSTSAIRLQLNRIGASAVANKKSSRKNWNKEDIELLKKLIVDEKKTPQEVAEQLERTEDSITIKANRLGLKFQTNNKRFWTKEEEKRLTELWGKNSFEELSEIFNRSISSIQNKAYNLGLGSFIDSTSNGLLFSEISNILGVQLNTVTVYWVSLGLKYKTHVITKNKSYKYVEIDDLLEFLEKNQNIWDSKKLEIGILGDEPEWLCKKRIDDSTKNLDSKKVKIIKQQLLNSEKETLDIKKYKLDK